MTLHTAARAICLSGLLLGLAIVGHALVHSEIALVGAAPFVVLAGGYRGLLYLRKR